MSYGWQMNTKAAANWSASAGTEETALAMQALQGQSEEQSQVVRHQTN